MLQTTIETWLGIGAFVLLGVGIAIWVIGQKLTRAHLNITPTIQADRRGAQELDIRLENLKSSPAEIRAAYLMFESGAGMALRPALPGSATLPLTLPKTEYANLRYDFETMTFQLSHHRNETIRRIACLTSNDDLIGHPVPTAVSEALLRAVEAVAPTHLQTCPGCSEFTTTPR